ncbi:Hypothetical protein PHPALM_3353 [Phytophthora palmivora]|uniref:Uncharacterized protein n=1 Tax=Phytophthora palmivora TaxID=4796 RepID=A0A2P4YMP3_9STRA|nr:Hypothetical protein PHPALM_3353 [Phytophthora palmivora]
MDPALKANFWNNGFWLAIYSVTPSGYKSVSTAFGTAVENIHQPIYEIVANSDNEWYTKRTLWAALKPLPGGLRQGIHREYPSIETSKVILEEVLCRHR